MRGPCVIWTLLLVAACSPAPRTTPPLVVLAVDGLDPAILRHLIDAGRTPNMARLASTSGLIRVTSTPGAEPASAWASFQTGVNPGIHGVFDLIAPERESGRPSASTLRPRPSARWFGSMWREGATYAPVRDGTPFWSHLGLAGQRSRVVFVPGTFPPEPVPAGSLVSGTPLPDWGGGLGTGYTWLASDVSADRVGFTRHGGRVERLAFTRNVAHATLIGLRAPERIDVPLTIAWNPEARSANLTIGDAAVHLNEGERSRWITIGAWLTPIKRVQGLVRLHLVAAGNDVQVYVSPIQWHPVAPPSAIAAPAADATTLFARIGPFRTLAWPSAAWAMADGWLPAHTFDTAQSETMADRIAAILSQVESPDWDLLVAGVETLAATTRLRWRRPDAVPPAAEATRRSSTDAVTDAYTQLDGLIGELQSRLPGDAGLIVVSPYGMERVTRLVDLNRWLTERGALAWHTPPAPVTMASLADPAVWRDPVDRDRSQARAMGAGHIYITGGGAEPEQAHMRSALQEDLERLTDPLSGRHVVTRVRTASEVFHGPRLTEAPDLIVSWAPGYGATWESMLGGMAAETVGGNPDAWLSGHPGADEDRVAGVWLSNLPVSADTMSVLDVAPTVMAFFGVPIPGTLDGRSQLRVMPSSTSRR